MKQVEEYSDYRNVQRNKLAVTDLLEDYECAIDEYKNTTQFQVLKLDCTRVLTDKVETEIMTNTLLHLQNAIRNCTTHIWIMNTLISNSLLVPDSPKTNRRLNRYIGS